MNADGSVVDDVDWDACSDERLVAIGRQHRATLARAFGLLMARHQQRVYCACLRYLRHEDDAREACQEVFLRVYRYFDRFEARASFRTWLYRIVQNQCHSLNRARSTRQQQLDIDQWADCLAAPDSDRPDGPHDQVTRTLARLSASDREILQRRFFADQSLAQLAAAEGIGLSAAKMRLYRAQERFKQVYQSICTADD